MKDFFFFQNKFKIFTCKPIVGQYIAEFDAIYHVCLNILAPVCKLYKKTREKKGSRVFCT